MWTKSPVKLKPKERKELKKIISKGASKARTITRARILLMAHEGKTDTHIIENLTVARNTVRTVRSRYIQGGLELALKEQSRSGAPRKFTGCQKAKITAIACSKAPEGRSRWTLRLIADKVVELKMADDISHQTVKRILKKTNLSLT